MCLTPTNSEVEDHPTLEGIEREHRIWVRYIVYSVRKGWWAANVTVRELLGEDPFEVTNGPETPPED